MAKTASLVGSPAKNLFEDESEEPALVKGAAFGEEEKPKFIIEEKVSPKPKRKVEFESKVSSIGEGEDDDELEIPAFIRRKMKK
jgi:hypothetical protein